jgi:DNA-binding CsgD family transcriptional regulator
MRPLAARQTEVLALFAEGETAKTAARRLGVSYNTVKRHVDLAHHRLGARTTPQAVALALRAGLIR